MKISSFKDNEIDNIKKDIKLQTLQTLYKDV